MKLRFAQAAALKDCAGSQGILDDPIDNYRFFIGSHARAVISSDLSVEEEDGLLGIQARDACGAHSNPDDLALQLTRHFPEETTADGPGSDAAVGGQKGASAKVLMETMDPTAPVPRFYPCISHCDLSDDSVGFVVLTKTIRSSAFYQNALFAFRVTVFATLPLYILLLHPSTSDFFIFGMLVPVFVLVFTRPTLGEHGQMMATCFQVAVVSFAWGVTMNAIGIIHHQISWWLALFFIMLAVYLLGDVQSKRFMMAHIFLNMQMEHTPGGDELMYSIKYLRDFSIACGMSCVGALLPYPALSRSECTEAMTQLHKLYSAAVGNAMKSYWASVRIDGRSALTQIPFAKMSALTVRIRTLIIEIQYEISEFGLDNTFREERLSALKRIKMHLYTMAAAASHRLEGRERSYISRDICEFEERVRPPAMALANEVMSILVAMGDYLRPVDVATKIDYRNLSNKACILADIIEREQARMLFLKRSASTLVAREETNSYLHTLSFLSSLVNISSEIQRMETEGLNFDVSRYPTVWRRAFNFFIADLWNDFWSELPKRFTLATPRDVRLWKDSFRYAIAFTVVCAFALYYGNDAIHYFSVIILMRLAHQTLSETLFSGVYNIFGMSLGLALASIIHKNTHELAGKSLITAVLVFILSLFSQSEIYGAGTQYAVVSILLGQWEYNTIRVLLVRLVHNVFAFILYLLICALIFPVDPIHCLWNARVKTFISLNGVLQSIVALGCAPITMSGLEAKFLADAAREAVKVQQLVLKEYSSWMPKAEAEPILRGSEYPVLACRKLLLYLQEISALEESVLDAMVKLHRPREKLPSVLVLDIIELIKPFMIDVSKIVHRFFQSVIDATERPLQWSMEDALNTTWKAQLACRSLKRVTGNIQKNFFAAYQELSAVEKHGLNYYLSTDMMASFRSDYEQSSTKSFDDESAQRLCTLSFHLSEKSQLAHEDVQAFNVIVTVFDFILRVMCRILPHMIAIHEFEKSRVV